MDVLQKGQVRSSDGRLLLCKRLSESTAETRTDLPWEFPGRRSLPSPSLTLPSSPAQSPSPMSRLKQESATSARLALLFQSKASSLPGKHPLATLESPET